jgi:tripartite-type tricarboxylate transporter receptor subunit TctC
LNTLAPRRAALVRKPAHKGVGTEIGRLARTLPAFAGSAPAVNALLGEHVTSVFADYNVVSEHIKAGKLRALAAPLRARLEPLPDVPTVAESGFNEYEADLWYGLVAPAKTSKETLSLFANWLIGAVQAPEISAKLVAIGLYPVGLCGTDFSRHLRKQYDQYGRCA